MTCRKMYANTGLVGDSRWTTVPHLNGALTRTALSAIHNHKAPTDPGGNAKAPSPLRLLPDPIPLRPNRPTYDTAA